MYERKEGFILKWYYSVGAGLAVLLFAIILIPSCIRAGVIQHRYEKDAEAREETTVIIRFYQSDEEDAPVGCMFIESGADFTVPYTPYKEGYLFAGWYNGTDENAVIYAGANGESIQTVTQETLLYPRFAPLGGAS